jgi:hypothetical protein
VCEWRVVTARLSGDERRPGSAAHQFAGKLPDHSTRSCLGVCEWRMAAARLSGNERHTHSAYPFSSGMSHDSTRS